MVRQGSMTLSFPPFTFAVKWLIIINTIVFLFMLLLGALTPHAAALVTEATALVPDLVVAHGWVWQLVTYSFQHVDLFHILFNMLTLWMFGAQLELTWKHRQFLEFYFFCVITAALTTVAVAYLGTISSLGFLGISPETMTLGASGGIYGVMTAFALLFGNMEFMLFPLPVSIRAKYLVAILIFISLVGALRGMGTAHRGESVAYFAHLGGAFFGWIYLRFIPRRGLRFATSEGYFGFRNRYIKWKRRRAAKKFEVYMRKQNQPTNYGEYFDEFGNYRDPNAKKKDNGEGGGPWVN